MTYLNSFGFLLKVSSWVLRFLYLVKGQHYYFLLTPSWEEQFQSVIISSCLSGLDDLRSAIRVFGYPLLSLHISISNLLIVCSPNLGVWLYVSARSLLVQVLNVIVWVWHSPRFYPLVCLIVFQALILQNLTHAGSRACHSIDYEDY